VSASAVVFAYHDVGVRCLEALLSHDVAVPLVVTHTDDAQETIWFESVAATAANHGLPCITPADPNRPEVERRVAQLKPDFIFSFYYRHMLKPRLLAHAKLGAFNMHGSLLPRYRGRSPVNWAILRGESETGITLHEMVERADAGAIVDQMAVPIEIQDDAHAVFNKITAAAETVLVRSLPGLIAGTAPRTPQDLAAGSYVGRRRPEDGRIDWSKPAREIHDLVRAVAPPFPGAFGEIEGRRWWIYRTRIAGRATDAPSQPQIYSVDGQCFIRCIDGGLLQILSGAADEGALTLRDLAGQVARRPITLS
jgi:methionyl-tRNA formyltransferase